MSDVENEVERETPLTRVLSNAWQWQLQTLLDLRDFIAMHGPLDREPLMPLNWAMGQTRSVAAEVWQYAHDPLTILRAYAAALDSEIIRTKNDGVYRVRGRIGALEHGAVQRRTQLLVSYTPPKDDEPAGSAR